MKPLWIPFLEGPAEQLRFSVPDLDTLHGILGRWLDEPDLDDEVETVYFDSPVPQLPFGGHLRASRRGHGSPDDSWVLVHKADRDSPNQVCPYPVSLADAPQRAADVFHTPLLQPLFKVRYTHRRYAMRNVWLHVYPSVEYTSMVHRPLPLGTENALRVGLTWRTGQHALPGKLERALRSLPCHQRNSMKWLGFDRLGKLFAAPVMQELPGYEYEIKLSSRTLDIDPSHAPFPLLDVRQSDSVRRYFPGMRAGIRDGAAIVTTKGPVQDIDGVLKRTERKIKGLSPWELDHTALTMRRFKRAVNVFNPDTGRVYTISLHECLAGDRLQQVEIEYDGTLIPDAELHHRKFRETGKTKHLLRAAEVLVDLGFGSEARALCGKLATIDPERAGEAANLAERCPGDREPKASKKVERAVIDDMTRIRKALCKHYDLSLTDTTKRSWLKSVLKAA